MSGKDYDKQVAVFARSLKWYINARFSPDDDYFAKILGEYFVPGKEFSCDLMEVYCSLLAEINNFRQLSRLMDTLNNFEIKNHNLIDVIISILGKGQLLAPLDKDLYDDLKFKGYFALTGF